MNKVFHYYYSKKGINSVSSRPVGSSSGIIKLSENNYNNINLETTIKKNLQNSNNNSSINNSSIKFNTKNQIKLTKNNFTTLPETNNNQNNYLNQNNHTLFFNNREIGKFSLELPIKTEEDYIIKNEDPKVTNKKGLLELAYSVEKKKNTFNYEYKEEEEV